MTRPASAGALAAGMRGAVAREAAGDFVGGQAVLLALAETTPGWTKPRLRLAQSLRAAGALDAAVPEYEAVLDADPAQPDALLGLAATLMTLGRDVPRAQMLLLRCCGRTPDRAEVWDALGVSFLLTEDVRAAETAFAEAQRLAPSMTDYALHRAEAALAAGTAEAELARLGEAIGRDPLDVASLTAQGLLLDRLGHRHAALDALEAAVALQPDAPLPTRLLGRLLGALNRPALAEAVLARAAVLEPGNPEPRNDRAVMLLRTQRAAEARSILSDLLLSDPGQPAVLCNLANAHAALGEQDEAVGAARRAIAAAPDVFLPWRTLVNTLPYQDGVRGGALLDDLRACANRLPRTPAPPWSNPPDPQRRLRVGLLSGSLRTHPVGWLTIAGWEALPPEEFELVCLAQDTATDPMARRFRAIAREWHDVGGLDDGALAEHARALGVDVLVDLGGYGESGRMSACALRLAPVQIKWVGMQNHSTGLPEMDWFVTDGWETPPGFERFYSERLLRLPDGYVCYSPPVDAPEVAPLPWAANGFVTFGCFNNLAKITPAVIETWAELLRAMPTARLVLKSHAFGDGPTRERVTGAFAALGVAPERVELQGASPHRQFLAEYRRVDLVLDPFPYSGGLTTCEALWMGVPVVTLSGETFAARHSTSHLSNIGLADWVAVDRADYMALALRKAANPAALGALRSSLRERVRASPLCDGPRFGRALGAALRHAWASWCANPAARAA